MKLQTVKRQHSDSMTLLYFKLKCVLKETPFFCQAQPKLQLQLELVGFIVSPRPTQPEKYVTATV